MSTAMAKTINNFKNLKLMVWAFSTIHFPAAFPKLAKKARFFPYIRAN